MVVSWFRSVIWRNVSSRSSDENRKNGRKSQRSSFVWSHFDLDNNSRHFGVYIIPHVHVFPNFRSYRILEYLLSYSNGYPIPKLPDSGSFHFAIIHCVQKNEHYVLCKDSRRNSYKSNYCWIFANVFLMILKTFVETSKTIVKVINFRIIMTENNIIDAILQ